MSDFPIAYKPVASYMAGGTSDFETVPVGTLAKLERMREALSQIDGMPFYLGRIPSYQVKGLQDRYNKALKIARDALEDTP